VQRRIGSAVVPSQSLTQMGPSRKWLFASRSSAIVSMRWALLTVAAEADDRRADVRSKAKVLLKVTINDYTLRSTVDNRDGQQYIVVNADARWNAAAKGADVIPIFAGEKR
jgi:hypothetical protein